VDFGQIFKDIRGALSGHGWSTVRSLDLGVTALEVKDSGGHLKHLFVGSKAAAERYVKAYDSVAEPDENSTPVATYLIPPNWAGTIPVAAAFDDGIWLRCTTGFADNDTGAPTANDVMVVACVK
jgi:hypothetical protein